MTDTPKKYSVEVNVQGGNIFRVRGTLAELKSELNQARIREESNFHDGGYVTLMMLMPKLDPEIAARFKNRFPDEVETLVHWSKINLVTGELEDQPPEAAKKPSEANILGGDGQRALVKVL